MDVATSILSLSYRKSSLESISKARSSFLKTSWERLRIKPRIKDGYFWPCRYNLYYHPFLHRRGKSINFLICKHFLDCFGCHALMHNLLKWSEKLQDTARFLKCICPFWDIIRFRVKEIVLYSSFNILLMVSLKS